MMLYGVIASSVMLVLIVITAINWRLFPRLMTGGEVSKTAHGVGQDGSGAMGSLSPAKVSVLIPARNEADVIGDAVAGLLAQRGTIDELIVLDDASTDGTAACALQAGRGDPRLVVIAGTSLPMGWSGKNWACAQLADRASGTVLVFSDAEVIWATDALNNAIYELTRSDVDLLAIFPTQITKSWSERLLVPLIAYSVLAYLPAPLAHNTPYRSAIAANGQSMIFRRATYDGIEGHSAVRANVLEDVGLARLAKGDGHRVRMVDAAGQITCRMYHDWHDVRHGFAKNILAGHHDSIVLLLLSSLFHIALFVTPWLWLLSGLFDRGRGWPLWPLGLIVAGVGIRAWTAAISRQRIGDAIFMPISVLLMCVIAGQAIWWRLRYGGIIWKGRQVKTGVS